MYRYEGLGVVEGYNYKRTLLVLMGEIRIINIFRFKLSYFEYRFAFRMSVTFRSKNIVFTCIQWFSIFGKKDSK